MLTREEGCMFIESLRILDTSTNTVMRNVTFHKGTNFVVDSEVSERHNKVGKTTFLKLIDILMGAQDRKLLYTDHDTGTVTVGLRDIIVNRKVAAELKLVDSLSDSPGNSAIARVELFPRGHYLINGTRVSAGVYREKLNALLFGIKNNVPTFRQLINSFVRVSVNGDRSAFLKTLPSGSTQPTEAFTITSSKSPTRRWTASSMS